MLAVIDGYGLNRTITLRNVDIDPINGNLTCGREYYISSMQDVVYHVQISNVTCNHTYCVCFVCETGRCIQFLYGRISYVRDVFLAYGVFDKHLVINKSRIHRNYCDESNTADDCNAGFLYDRLKIFLNNVPQKPLSTHLLPTLLVIVTLLFIVLFAIAVVLYMYHSYEKKHSHKIIHLD